MAEVCSVIAATVSLADISIRAFKETRDLFSKVSTASAEVKYLQRHLASLETYVIHVSTIRGLHKSDTSTSTQQLCLDIDNELRSCMKDLGELKILIQDPSTDAKSLRNRFGKVVTSVWHEQKIAKLTERLERRKANFIKLLSILGRHNDLDFRATLSTVSTNQRLVARKVNGNTRAVRSLTQGLNQTQHIIKSNQRQLSRQLYQQGSGIRKSILSSQRENRKLHQVIGAGFGATRNQLQRIQSQGTTAKEQLVRLSQHVHAKIDRFDNTLKGLNGICFNISKDKQDQSVAINGSAEKAAASLHLVFANLPNIFESLNKQPESFSLSRHDLDWLEDEFKNLLAAVDIEASSELRGVKKRAKYADKRRPTQPIGIQDRFQADGWMCPDSKPSDDSPHRRNAIELRETRIVIDLFIGKFIIFISETCPKLCCRLHGTFVNGVRMQFFPRQEVSVCGFAASSTYDWQGQLRVYPLLSTFGVLSGNAPIWKFIEVGNIAGVRHILGTQTVHPNDRDADYGNSLLGWAAWNHQKEICELLVREGADSLNCDAEGYSALSIYFRATPHRHKSGPQMVDGTRALIAACGADIVEHDKHISWNGTVSGIFSHGIVHRAILEMFPAWMPGDRQSHHFESLELLLQSGADPNERNGWGRTPLLTSAFQVRINALPKIIKLLLRYGADPLVIDGDDEGILHKLLYAFGNCGIKTVSPSWINEVTDIIVSLLNAGCDPNFKKDIGWTPSDNALSSPASWSIWCEAIVRAGHDPREVLRKDDELEGLYWTQKEIEEEYRDCIRLTRDRSGSKLFAECVLEGVQQPCKVCGEGFAWTEKSAPFDFMGTYLNPGLQYHQQLYNHSAGEFCPNYFGDNSCSFHRHEHKLPLSPEPKQLSWRKHTALSIWNGGLPMTNVL